MSFGRLFVAALLVAPVAGCGGSVLAVAADFSGNTSQYSENVIVTTIVLLSIAAFVAILAALLFVALPLTMILDRTGLPPLVRDLILTGAAALAALAFARRFPAIDEALALGLCYGVVTALLWVGAIRLLAPRKAAQGGPGASA